ncbi:MULTISPECIES: universal stress protein [Nocardiaceae]|uniref:universal stress protein n=1 Tax=Nocardiaceae TaxID=85025 RepID=UPI00050CC066|nr:MULTISPECIES: universal stress protein [Rhodococcus]MBJ7322193.1 universal stress protein [Rhodococcus sp. (in: high G+C Gram-positive bacteria)]
MSVLIAFAPGKGSVGALDLGAQLARSLTTNIDVATVVPKPWSTPSMARVDAEFADWAASTATESEAKARHYLEERAPDVAASFHRMSHRSVSTALTEAAETTGASILVLGSSGDGALGHVVVGSTADKLLHSSPVTVALAPRGYRIRDRAVLTRITCAFSGDSEATRVVGPTAELARDTGVPLRLASFVVRGATMYPPEIGLRAEDDVAAELARGLSEALTAAVDDAVAVGLPADRVDTELATAGSWREALDELHWQDGEVLTIGSSGPLGPIARVFLGSRATKIIRHSPVPILVLPRR